MSKSEGGVYIPWGMKIIDWKVAEKIAMHNEIPLKEVVQFIPTESEYYKRIRKEVELEILASDIKVQIGNLSRVYKILDWLNFLICKKNEQNRVND